MHIGRWDTSAMRWATCEQTISTLISDRGCRRHLANIADAIHVAMAERVALLRSLERIGSIAAGRLNRRNPTPYPTQHGVGRRKRILVAGWGPLAAHLAGRRGTSFCRHPRLVTLGERTAWRKNPG